MPSLLNIIYYISVELETAAEEFNKTSSQIKDEEKKRNRRV